MTTTTTKTMITAILIILMSSTAAAVIEEDWAYGKRNVAPDGIEYAYWDFEEGSCMFALFNNQHPSVAAFMNVISDPDNTHDTDEPSYVYDGGRAAHIYPWDFYKNPNGTCVDCIYVVNGHYAFAPRTSPSTVFYVPGREAYIVFKDDTHYVSFLASTGKDLSVMLYDWRGSVMHDATITRTIDRVGCEPSNFTRFSVHIPSKSITAMKLKGSINSWHIDDLIVGGAPGYLNKPVDYTYVARRAQELHGVDYLEHGLGADYIVFEYLDTWQFKDSILDGYWNPDTKQFEFGEGISNPGLIVWAYNYDSIEIAGTNFVTRSTVAGMEKHDFTVDVDSADTQPGDVCFMDRRDRNGDYGSDGYADEVYMVVEETSTGMDLITSCPDEGIGVIYSKKSISESSPAFMGYKRLPGVIRGGHNPIPKGH